MRHSCSVLLSHWKWTELRTWVETRTDLTSTEPLNVFLLNQLKFAIPFKITKSFFLWSIKVNLLFQTKHPAQCRSSRKHTASITNRKDIRTWGFDFWPFWLANFQSDKFKLVFITAKYYTCSTDLCYIKEYL